MPPPTMSLGGGEIWREGCLGLVGWELSPIPKQKGEMVPAGSRENAARALEYSSPGRSFAQRLVSSPSQEPRPAGPSCSWS